MHLNHIDLPVPDVAAATAFFVDGFGFSLLSAPPGMAILKGIGGTVLALSHDPAPVYPKDFHIGFLQPTAQAVTEAYQHLLAAGIHVPEAPAMSYGALLFYCQVPGGIVVEISYRGPLEPAAR